jgi:glutamate/tyrosine decarboxylase-like PLP-dependent enzyme
VDILDRAAAHAQRHLDSLPEAHAGPTASLDELRAALGGPMPGAGVAPEVVIDELAAKVPPGISASAGPRYFGFVTGGSMPAPLAADWLVSAWDQNVALYVMSPAIAVLEEVCSAWIADLLGLPEGSAAGFVTGCQAANTAGLAAGRHAVLERAGWDVESDGLFGAPAIEVFAGEQAHVTIGVSLRLLGLGAGRVTSVPADDLGRMDAAALADAMAGVEGPAIVCAQAGEVNTGAMDPIDAIADVADRHDAWLHVDGAFGLWAAASPALREQVRGLERADSWATDAHKWLNVPYDSGIVVVADPEAQRAALSMQAAYLTPGAGRDGSSYALESSRRARVVPVYAALRSLGRDGVAELVDRCCALARQMADELAACPQLELLAPVTLNQVLLGRVGGGEVADAVARIQDEGVCWLGGTVFRGRPAIRVSVSNWSTTPEDITRSAASIVAACEPWGAS